MQKLYEPFCSGMKPAPRPSRRHALFAGICVARQRGGSVQGFGSNLRHVHKHPRHVEVKPWLRFQKIFCDWHE